jgi:hypothetical protein
MCKGELRRGAWRILEFSRELGTPSLKSSPLGPLGDSETSLGEGPLLSASQSRRHLQNPLSCISSWAAPVI